MDSEVGWVITDIVFCLWSLAFESIRDSLFKPEDAVPNTIWASQNKLEGYRLTTAEFLPELA